MPRSDNAVRTAEGLLLVGDGVKVFFPRAYVDDAMRDLAAGTSEQEAK